jgi:hypothetical protein
VADTKISALAAVTAPATSDEFAVNQGGTSKKVSLATLIAYFQGLISGNSGSGNIAAGAELWQVLTANATANSTTTNAAVMTSTSLPAGTYFFRYDIIAQSGATTTAHKFAVQATGTVTRILYHLFFPSQGVTAATGVADQDINVTTGAVVGHLSARANNTTLGPLTDVDTANADVHYWIEGIVVTSTSGNLVLNHGSEVAASSQVMAGTQLYLKRLA